MINLVVEGTEFWGVEVGECGGVDEGVVELFDLANSCGFGVVLADFVEASESVCGVGDFVDAWHRDRAEDGDSVVEACEHGSEEGDALNEGDGTVDGVDDPLVAVGAVFVWELFSEDSVVGEVVCDSVAEFCFDGLVGDGDGGAVGFVVGFEGVFPEPVERDFGAGHGVGSGEGKALLKFFGRWGGCHAGCAFSACVRAWSSWSMCALVCDALIERRK